MQEDQHQTDEAEASEDAAWDRSKCTVLKRRPPSEGETTQSHDLANDSDAPSAGSGPKHDWTWQPTPVSTPGSSNGECIELRKRKLRILLEDLTDCKAASTALSRPLARSQSVVVGGALRPLAQAVSVEVSTGCKNEPDVRAQNNSPSHEAKPCKEHELVEMFTIQYVLHVKKRCVSWPELHPKVEVHKWLRCLHPCVSGSTSGPRASHASSANVYGNTITCGGSCGAFNAASSVPCRVHVRKRC